MELPYQKFIYFKEQSTQMAMDQVHIKDLLVRTIIGINPDERVNKQDVLINITLYADHSAAVSDDIKDVINYRTLTKQIIDFVENSALFLVEKMALEIVALCLADKRVERAVVTVEKPTALRFTRSVGVTVDRSQGHD
ncbi:FolB domain-containing protein [Anaerolineales bacterium HSG6]|nr:FolB domain-containing protein [Anaerolineales bacterium HSG6]MDM8530486.1 FolB domain-containing protein [Anaerolineales bacterium HSG25]